MSAIPDARIVKSISPSGKQGESTREVRRRSPFPFHKDSNRCPKPTPLGHRPKGC